MQKLELLSQELLAYARQIEEAVEQGNLGVIQSLAANAGRLAMELQEEADRLNEEAARNAFPDDLGDEGR